MNYKTKDLKDDDGDESWPVFQSCMSLTGSNWQANQTPSSSPDVDIMFHTCVYLCIIIGIVILFAEAAPSIAMHGLRLHGHRNRRMATPVAFTGRVTALNGLSNEDKLLMVASLKEYLQRHQQPNNDKSKTVSKVQEKCISEEHPFPKHSPKILSSQLYILKSTVDRMRRQ